MDRAHAVLLARALRDGELGLDFRAVAYFISVVNVQK
jgi:hypothetical protein